MTKIDIEVYTDIDDLPQVIRDLRVTYDREEGVIADPNGELYDWSDLDAVIVIRGIPYEWPNGNLWWREEYMIERLIESFSDYGSATKFRLEGGGVFYVCQH